MYPLYLILIVRLLTISGAYGSGIVGGKEAKKHSRPYMVSLQNNGIHVCGGMLIRSDFVLTSAHCFKFRPLLVVLGAHNIAHNETTQQKIQVQQYHPYPLYVEKLNYCQFDIMLLKLQDNAQLNTYVNIIKLPKEKEGVDANTKCSVAGWGMTTSKSIRAVDTLMEVEVQTEKTSSCKEVWQYYFKIKTMICTRTYKGKGFCQGDSGGPLVCNKMALGVVTFNYAEDCTNTMYPHVYMKISFFMAWIEKVMNRQVPLTNLV